MISNPLQYKTLPPIRNVINIMVEYINEFDKCSARHANDSRILGFTDPLNNGASSNAMRLAFTCAAKFNSRACRNKG